MKNNTCGTCKSSAFVHDHRPDYCCHHSVDRSAVYRSTKGCGFHALAGGERGEEKDAEQSQIF